MSRVAPATREPVEIAPRRSFSQKQRLEILLAGGGRCGICKAKIVGEFEVDHRIPLKMGGADDASNWQPAHPACHKAKTGGKDVPGIAKTKRLWAKDHGEKKPSTIQNRPFDKRFIRSVNGKTRARPPVGGVE